MKKAFTILELVFVIVILGILAAIALPKMSSSKDEAEVSKSLNNLKTLINDISIYTLKNDHLSSIKTMSNVSGVENVDLSNFNGIKEVNFRVGDDKECLKLVFINKADVYNISYIGSIILKNLYTIPYSKTSAKNNHTPSKHRHKHIFHSNS